MSQQPAESVADVFLGLSAGGVLDAGASTITEQMKLAAVQAVKGEANLLIMPNVDAANIACNLLKETNGEGITVGPILLGAARPAHILTPTATVRRLVNMTALAVVDANHLRT